MKRILLLSGLAVVLSAFIIVGSIATADETKYHNSFIRIFPSHMVNVVADLRIDTRKLSFAGFSGSQIYFQEHSMRGGILSTNLNLRDSVHIPLNIPAGFQLVVDSPHYFLQDGYQAIIQRGEIQDWCTDTTFNHLPSYTAVQPLSKNSFVLRTINPSKRKNFLIKPNALDSVKDILSTQVDGIFCTDGYFNYSKDYSLLIYTYRYRNQFLCIDTTLDVRMIGKTIDTTSQAKISVAEVNGELKLSKPPLVVNRGTYVSGRYLFVHSNLVAKNELRYRSDTSSVVDIYDILDGHYVGSFYIENLDDSKVQSFSIISHKLIVLFPGHIAVYNLNKKYLPVSNAKLAP